MQLYDPFGRLVTVMTLDISAQGDTRYVRRDIDDSLDKNYDWTSVVGSNVRIYNGKLYIKNDTDGLWYYLGCQTVDNVVTFYLSDSGIAI